MQAARIKSSKRRGHTMIELVVAMTSATALMAGIGGTIYIASRALDDGGSNAVQQFKDARLLGELMRDARYALSFSEVTDKAVTFRVPDRDGDNQPETIRYAWSGTPGDALTYEYNGSPPQVLVEDVKHFKLSTLTRFMAPPVIPPSEGGGNLLFVSGGAVFQPQEGDPIITPTAQEDLRIALIETWGYTVTLISDAHSQANFDSAVAGTDVAYVSEQVDDTALGAKLADAAIGVVSEEAQLIDDFGMASGNPTAITLTDASITDNTHYITSPFALGALLLSDPWQPFTYVNSGVAAGVEVPATVFGKSSLMVADTGVELLGGTPAPGRRVQLPWGSAGFDFSSLNADATTIMQRAIEWAAGAGSLGGGPLLFIVTDADTPTAQETARQTLMELWGYKVTRIGETASRAEISAAAALNDVAYVSQEIVSQTVGAGLSDLTIGVVNEEYLLCDELGFSSGSGSGFYSEMNVVDTTHYITSEVSPGALALFDPANDIYSGAGMTLAPDAQVLGECGIVTALIAVETGGELHGGAFAVGRRVLVPWGDDFAALNADGQTLMRRAIEWAAESGEAPALQNLLFVVADPANLNTKESGRKTLMEDWGYTVALINDGDTQANFDTAAAANDVIYVAGTINGGSLLDKLTGTTTAVVNEFNGKLDNFGFASSTSTTVSSDGFSSTEPLHYITEPFGGNPVTAFTASLSMPVPGGTLAAGLQNLGEAGGSPVVAALATGATRHDGGSAPARRVHLPYMNVEVSQMTADAKTIMKRAIEWAGGVGDGGGPVPTEIFVNDIAMGWRKQGANYYGQATVWVKDENGADVEGVTVSVDWSGVVTGTSEGVTGPDGKIMLESPAKRNGGTFTCTVTNAVKSGCTYNSSLNVETSDSVTAP